MAEQIEVPVDDENIDNEDIEEWRIIAGFDNYTISNLGRVRNDRTGRILRASLGGDGYLAVSLYNNGHHTKKIHKLVATAFIGDSNGLDVNHIDRNRQNNHVSNLEYCTRSANNRNRTAYGGRQFEYFDELPAGAGPINEVRGRTVAAGYYRNGFEFYVRVGPQYRRLMASRHGRNGWSVKVSGPNGENIKISWTP
jgi:hypothetical protein